MAQLFLIQEGTPHEATRPQPVAIETVTEKLTPFEKRYFDAPPDITPTDGAALIVKIDEAEINSVFPDAGWYHIPHLTPEDCQRLFGLKETPRH